MGTPALLGATSPLAFNYSNFPGGGTTPALLSQRPSPQRDVAALVQPNQEQALTEAFEGAVYRSLETSQALSFQFNALQGQLRGGGEGGEGPNVGFTSSQLQFDFFSETRYEELALFSQRTNRVVDGINGPQRASFLAASRQVATRFELSISISGAALEGFANTAEGADGSEELIDHLIEVTRKLLDHADEFFNDFFSQLGGDGGFSAESLRELFNEFISGIADTFNQSFLPALGVSGGQPGGGNGATASAVQLEFSFEFSARFSSTTAVVQQGDPIVFDLDDDGIELSSYKQGAHFDLIGSGRAQQVAFVQGGDAFLALDRNGDGQINSGKELFGEQHGARNGYEELRRFDSNRDGVIDQKDPVFSELRLFRDNGNGITEAGELLSLNEAGIESIQLDYREVSQSAAGGNRITQIGTYTRSDGSRGLAADALLNYIA